MLGKHIYSWKQKQLFFFFTTKVDKSAREKNTLGMKLKWII